MEVPVNNTLQQFRNLVGVKFQLYNSLFTALPFHKIEKTGVLLSLFLLHCEEGFGRNDSPMNIIDTFLKQYTAYATEQEQLDLLFRFVQYTERQVVLFDALEDAAFKHIQDVNGTGSLKHLQSEVIRTHTEEALAQKLQDFNVRLVLTAHPTQFYPGEVLGIINDLSKALQQDNTALVNTYLQQLGKTPFLKKEKPTPYDEALSLLWFLENVFYQSAARIINFLKSQFPGVINALNPLIRMGFWPGGDRDGNPFVKADTTLQVADALRGGIIKCYYLDVRRLKRRLTFKGVENLLSALEVKLFNNLFIPGQRTHLSKQEILGTLHQVREIILSQHNGLFVHLVDSLISKVELFGLYFASLDVRQDSSVHTKTLESIAAKGDVLPKNYKDLSPDDKIKALLNTNKTVDPRSLENDLQRDTLLSMQAIKTIQHNNGEAGCHRYIISHSTNVMSVMEVYGLLRMSGWRNEALTVDIVPLFETIDDLRNAADVMTALYENETYRRHIQQRGNTQTIMLGFSDGTKDGGYLMANWSIYKAKEELTRISRKYEVNVVFFDGRGGPPGRGGGKTHQFYASMGADVANKEIQLTIQGQTVSSNFGTIDTAQFNMEQLLHAGIANELFAAHKVTLKAEEESLLQTLADESYKSFNELKTHPQFLDYLQRVSPLRYYAEANIGSRPSKRSNASKLNLDDLRAVPYVGAWSQLKQNVPGYHGVGTALKKLHDAGRWNEIAALYEQSLFFRTLLDNSEMAMKKSYFPLTAYLAGHPDFGDVWKVMHEEFELTKKYVLKLSGGTDLMVASPVDQLSIQMRERVVLPLNTIQQYALNRIREIDEHKASTAKKEVLEKLVVRCSFGIINAGRNSA
ncbi:phosphoenolpyruvate carboxylase [Chitinophaga parva]|uniref:Phosphoenolpyruvate carboxylase n=1 Tax=Chitinophaga parva TaxID=2169414 RepID=A0A2T7BEN1_9BACT|nr:phosphoenolpyruvate carboxylase [Chitinophaga parva]PUZ24741.1 phosphoenolpyruvate carboxylase [Chitinophaga parva]